MTKIAGTEQQQYMFQKFGNEASQGIQYIEQNYLNSGSQYLFGDEISIADLALVNGINYVRLIGFDLDRFAPFAAWFNRVMSIPEISKENEQINGLVATAEKARADRNQ